ESQGGLTEIATGLGESCEPMRAFELGSDRTIRGKPFAPLVNALLAPPLLGKGPTAQDHRVRPEKRNNFLRGKSQVSFRHLSGTQNLRGMRSSSADASEIELGGEADAATHTTPLPPMKCSQSGETVTLSRPSLSSSTSPISAYTMCSPSAQ